MQEAARSPPRRYDGEVPDHCREEKIPAIIGLVIKHSGEIVEVDKQKAKWTLFQLKPGSASTAHMYGPEFHCLEHGNVLGTHYNPDGADAYLSEEAHLCISNQAEVAANVRNCELLVFMPDWKNQHLRVAVLIMQPDSVRSVCEWRRLCNVTTLGELLVRLGDRYAAEQIYYFYRTLRVVAVKRKKPSRSGDRAKKLG